MKRIVLTILLCLGIFALFAGCASKKEPQTVAIANPWSTWDSIKEAENATGFSFGLPDVIADSYIATEFRTMNGELVEVVYCDGDFEVCIRKAKDERQDISGDYNQYETCNEERRNDITIITYGNSEKAALKQLIYCQGYSWSMIAPNGYWGDSNEDFLRSIMES